MTSYSQLLNPKPGLVSVSRTLAVLLGGCVGVRLPFISHEVGLPVPSSAALSIQWKLANITIMFMFNLFQMSPESR